MNRNEKVTAALKLRNEGKLLREIAAEMGVARSTAGGWLEDPDLSKQKARRARYSQPCVDCGKPTDGSGGYKQQRTRCNACFSLHIIVVTDEMAEYAQRRYVEDGVGFPTIAAELGVSPDAVERALLRRGVESRGHGRGAWTRLPVDDMAEQYEAGDSMRMIADRYGVHEGTVYFQLKPLGIVRTASDAQMVRRARNARARMSS